MKQTRRSGLEGFAESDASDPKPAGKPTRQRREGMVLIAIAILFVANVLLYLCHHYKLMHLGQIHRQPEPTVLID